MLLRSKIVFNLIALHISSAVQYLLTFMPQRLLIICVSKTTLEDAFTGRGTTQDKLLTVTIMWPITWARTKRKMYTRQRNEKVKGRALTVKGSGFPQKIQKSAGEDDKAEKSIINVRRTKLNCEHFISLVK
jgi:hypothetical protein